MEFTDTKSLVDYEYSCAAEPQGLKLYKITHFYCLYFDGSRIIYFLSFSCYWTKTTS